MNRSATDYIAGHYDCHVQLRGVPPKTIEVSEALYNAYEAELYNMERFKTLENISIYRTLMYKACIICKYTNWSARAML